MQKRLFQKRASFHCRGSVSPILPRIMEQHLSSGLYQGQIKAHRLFIAYIRVSVYNKKNVEEA